MRGLRGGFWACSTVLALTILWFAAAGRATAAELQFGIFHAKTDAFGIAEEKWMEAVTKQTAGRVKRLRKKWSSLIPGGNGSNTLSARSNRMRKQSN